MSGPGGKNEATGDNIRKDGTDADNADGKSAQLDSTAQPDRSGPNGGPSGRWETRPVYETQRVQVPTGRAIFEHDGFTANANDPAFEEHGDYLLKSGLPDNYRYEKVWQDKQIQVGTRQEDHGSYQAQSIKSGKKGADGNQARPDRHQARPDRHQARMGDRLMTDLLFRAAGI